MNFERISGHWNFKYFVNIQIFDTVDVFIVHSAVFASNFELLICSTWLWICYDRFFELNENLILRSGFGIILFILNPNGVQISIMEWNYLFSDRVRNGFDKGRLINEPTILPKVSNSKSGCSLNISIRIDVNSANLLQTHGEMSLSATI